MNSVERVKSICKARKIPISRLEKDLGYANGYIGQLRKGSFPDNRLVEIAAYLNLSVSELTGEPEQKENAAPETGSGVSEIDAIFDSLSPSNQTKLLELARLFLDDQRKKEGNQ